MKGFKKAKAWIVLFSALIFGISLKAQSQENQATQEAESPYRVLMNFGQYDEQNRSEQSPYSAEVPEDWRENPDVYSVTQDDMDLDQWIVSFNSSSNRVENTKFSYTKKVTTKSGDTVLGARIHFPLNNTYASHAYIRPFYEIMEYNSNGILTNIGNGVVENVSILKEIRVEVSGRNYNNRLILRLKDQYGRHKDFFLGNMNFAGWRRLVWKNPRYESLFNRQPIRSFPLYPKEEPYLKFNSFIVSRPDGGMGGDFVVYFRKIEMIYDLYDPLKENLSIEDENTWGIQKYRNQQRDAFLKKKNRDRKIYREYRLLQRGNSLSSEPKEIEKTTQPAEEQ